jgi:hypothetical protein
MRLADFIRANAEPILVEWEIFARSIWPPGATADPDEVRDDAEGILLATASDMVDPYELTSVVANLAGRTG